MNEHAEAKTQHALFQLYIHDNSNKKEQSTIKRLKKQVEKAQKKRAECEGEIKKEKAEVGKIQREVNSIEKKCEDKQAKIMDLRPAVIKARENTSHTQHKLESVKKRLETALKIHSQKQNIIQELQTQLDDLEKRRKIFEDQIQCEQSEKNVELKQSQLTQYHKLKEKVATRSAELLSEIQRYDREQTQDQENLDLQRRKRADIERALKGKRSERDEHESRTDRLREYIETNKEKLKTYEKQKIELESEVKNADTLITQVNTDLEQVMNKLGSASVEKTESRRQQRRNELVEKLKVCFHVVAAN